MDISVVLCTYNNAGRLRVTLQSFCRLNQPEKLDWELVTVNNNSTDNTETVIKSFDDRLPIRYVYEPEQGLSCARNAGLDVAEGELIVFTDDDVKPNPDWLAAYWEAYREHPEGYYFGGPIESEYEGEPPDEDLLRAAMPSVAGLNHGSEPHAEGFFVGANWACPMDHIKQVGTFDSNLGLNANGEGVSVGEEGDMMVRLQSQGIEGWYIPQASIRHFVPKSKATLEHIVARNRAGLKDLYSSGSEKPTTLFGMPLGLYKKATGCLVEWVLRKALGRPWKSEYVKWRSWSERVKVYHENAG